MIDKTIEQQNIIEYKDIQITQGWKDGKVERTIDRKNERKVENGQIRQQQQNDIQNDTLTDRKNGRKNDRMMDGWITFICSKCLNMPIL